MFKHLRHLFNKEVPEQVMPQKESDPAPKLDISEPVFRMVEVVINNPSRIKVKGCKIDYGYSTDKSCVIIDNKTKTYFHVFISKSNICNRHSEGVSCDHIYFTNDESEFLISKIGPIIDSRINRAKRIKEIARNRENDKARADLLAKLAD